MYNTTDSYTTGTFLGSKYLNPDYIFHEIGVIVSAIYHFLFRASIVHGIYGVLSVIGVILLFFLAYSAARMIEIRHKEHKYHHEKIHEYGERLAEREKKIATGDGGQNNEQWAQVLTHIFSNNVSDWKLAIIEADSMLDTLLTQLGYKGENLGEKLKSIDREKFRNLTAAWEVHTIRNRIAHEGLAFDISQHEAKRVVSVYEQIFREFGYV